MKTSLSNHHLGCGENAELVTDSGAGTSEQPLEEGQPTAREDAPMNIDKRMIKWMNNNLICSHNKVSKLKMYCLT